MVLADDDSQVSDNLSVLWKHSADSLGPFSADVIAPQPVHPEHHRLERYARWTNDKGSMQSRRQRSVEHAISHEWPWHNGIHLHVRALKQGKGMREGAKGPHQLQAVVERQIQSFTNVQQLLHVIQMSQAFSNSSCASGSDVVVFKTVMHIRTHVDPHVLCSTFRTLQLPPSPMHPTKALSPPLLRCIYTVRSSRLVVSLIPLSLYRCLSAHFISERHTHLRVWRFGRCSSSSATACPPSAPRPSSLRLLCTSKTGVHPF